MRNVSYILSYSLVLILVFLAISVSTVSLEFKNRWQCEQDKVRAGGYCIEVILKSTRDKGEAYESYNFPINLRQYDKLWIEKLTIYNLGDTPINGSWYDISIRPAEGHNLDIYSESYGKFRFYIDPLNPGDRFEFRFNPETWKYDRYLNNRKIHSSRSFRWIELYKTGEWIITSQNSDVGFVDILNGLGDHLLFNVNKPMFETEEFILENIKDLVTIALMVVAIIIPILIGKKQIIQAKDHFKEQKIDQLEAQKDLIRSLRIQSRVITRDLNGHLDEYRENKKTIPSYDLHKLDAHFYLTHLRSEYKNKETEIFKETISLIANKVETINGLLKLAREDYSLSRMGAHKNPYVKELTSKTYYDDLVKLLENLDSDISKLLGP